MGFLILNHDADGFRQERYIRDLNLEFTNIIELAESAKSAQVAAGTLYKVSRLADKRQKKAQSGYCDQGEPRNSDY